MEARTLRKLQSYYTVFPLQVYFLTLSTQYSMIWGNKYMYIQYSRVVCCWVQNEKWKKNQKTTTIL